MTAALLLCFVLAACTTPSVPPTPAAQGLSCHERIRDLSVHDRALSSRLEHKVQAAKNTQVPEQFVAAMLESREDGEAFACGLTRSWVTEVFEGLEQQYVESRHDDGIDGSRAGYRVVRGDELQGLFQVHAGSARTVIYHVRHTGTEDHVFTVEQLPRGQGYRIYQSYINAYSLNAWLSTSTTGLYAADTGELMLWRGLQAAVNQSLAQISGGQASLDNLDALPADWEFARPYYEYVRDYDEARILANFERAWTRYGQGRVLTQAEFFDDYLVKLAGLEVYFRQNDHLGTPFPEEVWNTWIELYASPNVLHFPGLPNNVITDMLLAGRDYRLEILEVVLPGDDDAVKQACAANTSILDASLKTP
ncbi:hypothetical protein [Corallococcus terminator]|uniref:Uncharacterized protein n=1 Tax=Corallococcus terminator TaxID=2316733 RepID=A0A3A8I7G3_9BACT|nr:hypothetical protein [Corallococcus terminator]RKG79397.1 hypothetical protein D7V88_28745 [Corallococcus terminator]